MLDHIALDEYFRLRGAHRPAEVAEALPYTKDIVIVKTDHILPRPILAKLLYKLRLSRVIACDLMLEDHSAELNPEEIQWYRNYTSWWKKEDTPLIQEVHQLHQIILGSWLEEQTVPDSGSSGNTTTSYKRQWVWQNPIPKLWQSAHYHAHLVLNQDEQDGVVRDVSLFQKTQEGPASSGPPFKRLPCLGLSLAAAAKGMSPQAVAELVIHDGYLQFGSRRIPVDATGRMLIDYVGGRECFDDDRNRIDYKSVLSGFEADDFKDKIVIIGEISRRSKEIMLTPFGEMPAVAIHANVVSTLLNLQGPPVLLPIWQVGIITFICCATLIPLLRLPLWASLSVAIGEIGLMVLLGAAIFSAAHAILPVSVPDFAIFLTYNALVLYEYRRTHRTIGQFVDPALASQILHTFSRLHPEVRSGEASAVFCDLYGYSVIIEAMPGDQAAQFANAYMETVMRVVKRYKGRLIDYVGDGVFLLFEKSRLGDAYIAQAVKAALQLEADIRSLGQQWFPERKPPLQAGIGIETGLMMIGILGSEQRLKLGAVGKPVNVACHVQALTRQSGYNILVTHDTYTHVKDSFEARYYDTCLLKGRPEATALYGITSSKATLD